MKRRTLVLATLVAALVTLTSAFADDTATIRGKVSLKSLKGEPVEDASGVVVFIDNLKGKFDPPKEHASMASRGKIFVPSVLPIMQGTTVDFPNDDTIFHNVFSLSKTHPFDLGLYKKGVEKSVVFDKAGLVKVYCNVHENMVAYLLVLENPFFAITDKEGRFTIKGIPAGKVDVLAWHRYGDQTRKTVTLAAGTSTFVGLEGTKGEELDFDMIEKDTNEKHLNKWGKEYKDKY